MENFINTRDNQKGSIILIVLMLLVLMSIIGIASTNSTVTESTIVRNIGIQKQNLYMVDTAMNEALQMIIDMDLVDPVTGLSPDGFTSQDLQPMLTSEAWITSDEAWEAGTLENDWNSPTHVGAVLTAANSIVPPSVTSGVVGDGIGTDDLLNQRGDATSSFRFAFLGWDAAPGYSLKTTTPSRKSGRLLGEYISSNFGIMKLEIGLEKKW